MRIVMIATMTWTAACVTHLPPNQLVEKRYLDVTWADDFDAARARAREVGKPMFVVLVAGQLDGLC